MQHHRVLEEELKSVCNLVHIISNRVELEPVGRCFRGNCPFCPFQDHDRSLHVYPEREVWRCFGPCQSGGDAAEFLAAADQISRGQAIRALALKYGLATADPVNTVNSSPIDDYLRQTYLSGPGSVEFRQQEYKRRMEQRLGRVLDLGYLDADEKAELLRRPTIKNIDDRELTAGNLVYIGKLADITYRGSRRYLRALRPGPTTVGILTSTPETLQKHADIETPDGQFRIEDATRVYNGGEITWYEGEAIYRDLESGIHYPTTLLGCSSKGFCLIQIDDSPSPLWVWPREPEEIGGRDRPFPYRKAGESEVSYISLESFFIQNSLDGPIPESFTDLSGVVVPINAPKSSPKRHADRIRFIRGMDRGAE